MTLIKYYFRYSRNKSEAKQVKALIRWILLSSLQHMQR